MSAAPDRTDKVYGLADSIGRSMCRLLAAIFLAPICGPDLYSVFVLCVTIEVIATTLPNAVFLSPMLSIGPGLHGSERDPYLRCIRRRHLRWSLVGAILGAAFAPLFADRDLPPHLWVAFGAALLATGALNGARAVRQARFEARVAFWSDTGALVLPPLAILLFASSGAAVALTIYFGTLAATSAIAAWTCVRGTSPATNSESAPTEAMERTRRMGPPMATGSVAYSVSSRVQPFVLQLASGASAVSVFGAANTLIGPLRLVAMAAAGVLRPRLSFLQGHGEHERAWQLLVQVCLLLAGSSIAAIILAALMGPWLSGLVFGAGFDAVGSLLPIAFLFAGLEASAAIMVVALQVLHANGTRTATRYRVAVSGIAVLAVWPACAWGAAQGAFFALCATELAFLGMIVLALRRALAPAPEVAAV